MVANFQKSLVEDIAVIGGLIGVQFVYAGNSVLLSYLMSLGLHALTIVVYTSLATFLILTPVALAFERNLWPKRIRLKLIVQIFSISFGGVTLFQSLFLKGINLTSPAMATAMPNLAPGFIFVIAWTFRLEKVNFGCIYSKVKIVGTVLLVVGALTMSIMHSAETKQAKDTSAVPSTVFNRERIIGCLYLIAAVIVLSSNIVLQASTLGEFPAPISMCTITNFIGMFTTLAVQLIEEKKVETGWPLLSFGQLVRYSLLAGAISGTCVSFNNWAMKKRGPVLVAMFNPISTVISAVLSFITLGETMGVGSVAGMILMFTGLYFVLWAKGKESRLEEDSLESELESDGKKPLLS